MFVPRDKQRFWVLVVSLHLAFVSLAQGTPSIAAADTGTAVLITAVVDAQTGDPVENAYVTLWRELAADEPEPKNTVNGPGGFGYYDPVIWEDAEHHVRWVRAGSARPRGGRRRPDANSYQFDSLQPGRYRVTAVTYRRDKTPDPTPYGVSKLLELKPGEQKNTNIRLTRGSASLEVTFIDAQTRKPIPGLAVRLRNAGYMPIVHGHGSGNFFEWTGDGGQVVYAGLEPGKFTMQLLGRQARVNDFVQYEPVKKWVSVEAESGENTFEIEVEPRGLEQAEIDRRFPFSIFGRVTDQAGNALGGVEVRAATGIGTLFGGGRTTTDAEGKYRLYFSRGTMLLNRENAPRGVGVQAAHFSANKPGWKLDADDGYIFYLMTDQTPQQFAALLKRQGGRYWGKDSAEEVVFPNQPQELNFVLKKEE